MCTEQQRQHAEELRRLAQAFERYVHTLCVSSGDSYHQHCTAITTPYVERLVLQSSLRQ